MMRRDPLLSVSNSSRNGRTQLLIATVIVVVIFVVDMLSGGSLRSVVRSSVALVSREAAVAGSAVVTSGMFASNHALTLENQELKTQLAAYTARDAQLTAAEQEQSDLRALAHLASTSKGLAVPIVSSILASPYGTFLIGAGSAQKIAVGSIVVLADGYAVGRVAEVRPDTSVVREFFAPNSEIDVRIGSAPVHLIGRGGENAYGQAARGSVINIGDVVNAPAIGRPVGVVGATASSSAEAYQDVYVRLPNNLGAATLVYVLSL